MLYNAGHEAAKRQTNWTLMLRSCLMLIAEQGTLGENDDTK